ncbi:hypothetical protein ASD66_02930 [Nocardioides sp. Root151]|nr:hypothetical protein ASD66_02930 [Nocardioides sp. Root151]
MWEDAVLVAGDDLFAHGFGWVVLVDGPVVVEVDDWGEGGVGAEVTDPVEDLLGRDGAEQVRVRHPRCRLVVTGAVGSGGASG